MIYSFIGTTLLIGSVSSSTEGWLREGQAVFLGLTESFLLMETIDESSSRSPQHTFIVTLINNRKGRNGYDGDQNFEKTEL